MLLYHTLPLIGHVGLLFLCCNGGLPSPPDNRLQALMASNLKHGNLNHQERLVAHLTWGTYGFAKKHIVLQSLATMLESQL